MALTTLNGVSPADVTVQANVNVAAGQAAGLVARYGGPADGNMYWGTLISTGGGQFAAQIWRNVGGTWKLLAASSPLASGAGLLRFDVAGSELRLFVDGTLRAFASDTALATPGMAGLRSSGNQTFDNVLIDALGLAASTPLSSDSFDRADAATLGGNWTNRVGTTGVAGNAARATAPVATATLDGVSQADVAVEADVDVAAGQAAGVVARYGGPGDANMYWGTLIATSVGGTQFAAQIWKNVGGTWTRLASTAVASGAGRLRFEAVGSLLRLYVDGTLMAAASDGSITAAGLTGLRSSLNQTADNFAVSGLTRTPTPLLSDPFDRANAATLGDRLGQSRRRLRRDRQQGGRQRAGGAGDAGRRLGGRRVAAGRRRRRRRAGGRPGRPLRRAGRREHVLGHRHCDRQRRLRGGDLAEPRRHLEAAGEHAAGLGQRPAPLRGAPAAR